MVLTKDGVPERISSRNNGLTCNIRCKEIEFMFTVLTLSVAWFTYFLALELVEVFLIFSPKMEFAATSCILYSWSKLEAKTDFEKWENENENVKLKRKMIENEQTLYYFTKRLIYASLATAKFSFIFINILLVISVGMLSQNYYIFK